MRRNGIFLVLAVSFLFLFQFLLFLGSYQSFNLRSLDGSFQNLALVQAVDDGRILGVDFFPYLGPLIAYILYLPYILLGGDLLAVTASTFMFATFAATLTILVLAWLSEVSRAASLLVATAVLILFWKFPLGISLTDLHMPGNSLRSIRWAWPYAAVCLIWVAHLGLSSATISARSRFYGLLAAWGMVAGLSLFWSPDSGVSSLIVLFLVWPFLGHSFHSGIALIARWALMIAVAAVTAFLFGQAISAGHLGAWFQYLFIGLPSEQFWLFGYWEDFRRVYDLGGIFGNVLAGFRTSLVIPTALMALRLLLTLPSGLDARLRRTLLAFAGLSVCATAMLPQVGGVVDDRYGLPVLPAFAFLAIVSIRELAFRNRKTLINPVFAELHVPGRLLGFGKLALFAVPVALMVFQVTKLVLREPPGTAFIPEFGLRVRNAELPYFEPLRQFGAAADAAGLGPDERIFPIYLSANEVLAGATLPSPYGMTIHALGPHARAEHLKSFLGRTYPLVTTINPDYDSFANWNLRASWYLFREIISRYRPYAKSKQHIFWIPRTAPLPGPYEMTCKINSVAVEDLDLWGRPESRLELSVTGAEHINAPYVYVDIEVDVSVRRAPSSLPKLGDRMLLSVLEVESALGENETLHVRRPVKAAFWRRILRNGGGDLAPDSKRRYGVGAGSGTLTIVVPHKVGSAMRLILESRPSDRTAITAHGCSAAAMLGYVETGGIPDLAEDMVIPLYD
ncbi:hypothetical protein J4729_07875 [Leisingera sp. HS039]|uniref:hypothetical protein n=1 Tax=Leisingera sp. HS039 TaxID=2818496 RepID=UPI001B39CF83|nr:hypothetical protein [Leisingera sp. HS039]MBQ4824469.1 hypothetical protein [Leisingera sp. HS039]